jgi:hypothetical protein
MKNYSTSTNASSGSKLGLKDIEENTQEDRTRAGDDQS